MANATEITTAKARPKLGHSAQSKWQKKQQADGNCRSCGKPRATEAEAAAGLPARLKQHCPECQKKVNEYMKSYRAGKKTKGEGDGPTTVPDPGPS